MAVPSLGMVVAVGGGINKAYLTNGDTTMTPAQANETLQMLLEALLMAVMFTLFVQMVSKAMYDPLPT